MKKAAFSLLVLLISLVVVAQEKETRNEKDFSGISFAVSGELYLTQGSGFSVILEGDKDLLEQIETSVKNGTLQIRKKDWRKSMNKRVKVWVTMPEVDNISVSGSGKVSASSEIESDELDLSVSGSGTIKLDKLAAGEIGCGISGSGKVYLDGSGARECDLSISGSGEFSGLTFETAEMTIAISGSGRCDCNVSKDLNVRISGSGNVFYNGNPNVDSHSSGSGRVKKN